MSAIVNPFPTFSPASPDDIDTYGENCAQAMAARGTTIVSVGAPEIAPPVHAPPLTITDIQVVLGGNGYAFKATGGVAGVNYLISFPLTLSDGDVLHRTVMLPVREFVG